MPDPHNNFAVSAVATAPSPATSGTSLVVTAGQGTLFPDPSVSGPYNIVVCPANTQPTTVNAEVCRVTARATDTLTITRAQEGSTARSITVGDTVFLAITAKVLTDLDLNYPPGFTAVYAGKSGTYVDQMHAIFDQNGAYRIYNNTTIGEVHVYNIAGKTDTLISSSAPVTNDEGWAPALDEWFANRVAWQGTDNKVHWCNLDGTSPGSSTTTFDSPPRWLCFRGNATGTNSIVCVASVSSAWGVYQIATATGAATLLVSGLSTSDWVTSDTNNSGALAYSKSGVWFTAAGDGTSPVQMTNAVLQDNTDRPDFRKDGKLVYIGTGGVVGVIAQNNTGATTYYTAAPGQTLSYVRSAADSGSGNNWAFFISKSDIGGSHPTIQGVKLTGTSYETTKIYPVFVPNPWNAAYKFAVGKGGSKVFVGYDLASDLIDRVALISV